MPADPCPSVTLLQRFPPRPAPASWALTSQPKPQVLGTLQAPPFPTGRSGLDQERRRGVTLMLDWLERQPGDTWQDRWIASGADAAGNPAWRGLLAGWLAASGRGPRDPEHVSLLGGRALLLLICADVIRPSLGWLLAPATPTGLSAEMTRVRDPAGFAALAAAGQADHVNSHTAQLALRRIAAVLAAKGGLIADITIGDCLELMQIAGDLLRSTGATSPYFYQLLRAAGMLGTASPPGRALTQSGRAMIEALIAGERDPAALAGLAKGKLRPKIPQLTAALDGHFGAHHAVVAAQILAHLDSLDGAIAALDGQIAARVAGRYQSAARLLADVPGLERRSIEVIIAETGTDMSRFPSPAHLASWAGLCPGNHESAASAARLPPRRATRGCGAP
ncbi:MAG: transposase [Streptosporangiaceae bacterium]